MTPRLLPQQGRGQFGAGCSAGTGNRQGIGSRGTKPERCPVALLPQRVEAHAVSPDPTDLLTASNTHAEQPFTLVDDLAPGTELLGKGALDAQMWARSLTHVVAVSGANSV